MSTKQTPLTYQSSKTYTHSTGLSCCFRQWRADSHCRVLHGYALKVEVVFQGTLDERNWVRDFGSLKPLKKYLEDTFDHKTVIAFDDPRMEEFQRMGSLGLIDLVTVPAVGCEKFAEQIFRWCENYLEVLTNDREVNIQSVQVWEHEGNSAKVIRQNKSFTATYLDDMKKMTPEEFQKQHLQDWAIPARTIISADGKIVTDLSDGSITLHGEEDKG